MRGRLGAEVAEGDGPLPVHHDRGRDLAGGNPAGTDSLAQPNLSARWSRTTPSRGTERLASLPGAGRNWQAPRAGQDAKASQKHLSIMIRISVS